SGGPRWDRPDGRPRHTPRTLPRAEPGLTLVPSSRPHSGGADNDIRTRHPGGGAATAGAPGDRLSPVSGSRGVGDAGTGAGTPLRAGEPAADGGGRAVPRRPLAGRSGPGRAVGRRRDVPRRATAAVAGQ